MPAATPPIVDPSATLDYVRDALRTLRYGTITLTVHNGVVVHADRTERQRFDHTR
jgi:hypothetical protein